MVEAVVSLTIAAVAAGAALNTRLHQRINDVHNRINDLDRRIDDVELTIAQDYVSKSDLQIMTDRMENHMVRIETKLDQIVFREPNKDEEKATEDQFNELHNLVTKEFLARIKSGEATTQDLKAACDWLKTNDIGCRYGR